jgi:hypothetical protein
MLTRTGVPLFSIAQALNSHHRRAGVRIGGRFRAVSLQLALDDPKEVRLTSTSEITLAAATFDRTSRRRLRSRQQGSLGPAPKARRARAAALIESIVEAHPKDVVALIEGAGQAARIGWI